MFVLELGGHLGGAPVSQRIAKSANGLRPPGAGGCKSWSLLGYIRDLLDSVETGGSRERKSCIRDRGISVETGGNPSCLLQAAELGNENLALEIE